MSPVGERPTSAPSTRSVRSKPSPSNWNSPMPCSDDRRDEPNPHYQTLVRLACERCREIELHGGAVPHWAAQWWAEHQEVDRQRRAREAAEAERARLRKYALAKLSPEER